MYGNATEVAVKPVPACCGTVKRNGFTNNYGYGPHGIGPSNIGVDSFGFYRTLLQWCMGLCGPITVLSSISPIIPRHDP
ncbi:hypothetical protein NECAME_12603 [Necator americanus]|uniref:Uncharacterized protein n=1 Tax=Necator americanus TaxID=51031 RepID=W2SZ96_NECAM|nr:hypothetical protein NECAME_12603 [Necator americanus]ETN74933.1 hypothetical protein NECAME_12603 [Necator americanus]